MYDYGCKNHSGRILVKRSIRKAAAWCRRAAELGSEIGQSLLGTILSAPGATEASRREAVLLYQKAFRGGASHAANNLAITYRESGDMRRAVLWFKKSAASKKDDGAYIQLGIHYYWGKGVRVDFAEAVRCFRKAIKGKRIAEAERDDAFFYLGIAHLEGNGVKPSLVKGRKLLERANIDNDHLAASRLLKRLKVGSPR
jgi:TPR repeat protein